MMNFICFVGAVTTFFFCIFILIGIVVALEKWTRRS